MKKTMAAVAQSSLERDSSAEIRLWHAVISSTVNEWVHGPLRRKREAEQYLFDDTQDFNLVCQLSGMDSKRLRARLVKVRDWASVGANSSHTGVDLLTDDLRKQLVAGLADLTGGGGQAKSAGFKFERSGKVLGEIEPVVTARIEVKLVGDVTR
jgi:hypothetical protein